MLVCLGTSGKGVKLEMSAALIYYAHEPWNTNDKFACNVHSALIRKSLMFQQWNVEVSFHIYKHARSQKTTDKTQSKSVPSINTRALVQQSDKKEETIFPPYTDTNAAERE